MDKLFEEKLNQHPVAVALQSRFPGALENGSDQRAELSLFVQATQIEAVCRFLKDEQGYIRLSGITAVDWYPAEPRFEIVYLLHSLEKNNRLRLKCRVSESSPEIDSVIRVWRAADWYEREIFDMFGVTFRNHPDLRRLLMPTDWEGHPLRKDFPVHGHKYSYQDE